MSDIQIGKAPDRVAVLPFYAASALAFLLLSGLLLSGAFVLQGHFFHPYILAVVHACALGWGTMVIFGAAYQLLPVIFERELYSARLAWISFVFLTAGAVVLIFAFWNFLMGWFLISGGLLVLVAALLFLANAVGTAGKRSRYAIQKVFILSAATWLCCTVLIGTLLAIHFRYPFIPKNHMEILKLHAHAGLAGWFLQLIMGVSVKLVPMFLLGKSEKERLLRSAFGLINSGLILFLVDGYVNGTSFRYLIYAAWIAGGITCWLVYLADVYRHRVKKKVDYAMRHTLVSLICLLIAVALLPAVYLSVSAKWAVIYGLFLFVGWISSIILGMTFKTLPFIVWNNHYKKLNGVAKVPLPRQLYSEKLFRIQFYLFISALYITALSLILNSLLFLRAGLVFLVLVALLYNINVFRILLHKTKPWPLISV